MSLDFISLGSNTKEKDPSGHYISGGGGGGGGGRGVKANF